jgi:hypothetical protein
MHQPPLRLPRSGLWAISGVEAVFARGFASKSQNAETADKTGSNHRKKPAFFRFYLRPVYPAALLLPSPLPQAPQGL